MSRLLSAAGFTILEMTASFGSQYFSILARKDGVCAEISPADPDVLNQTRRSFGKTRALYFAAKERFSACSMITAGKEGTSLPKAGVYLWGAAGKGVMCCNLLGEDRILGCVDKNPFKQGKFIPGTGQPVLAPSNVSYEKVKYILVANDVYFAEIEQEVREIDKRIQVLSLNTILGITSE